MFFSLKKFLVVLGFLFFLSAIVVAGEKEENQILRVRLKALSESLDSLENLRHLDSLVQAKELKRAEKPPRRQLQGAAIVPVFSFEAQYFAFQKRFDIPPEMSNRVVVEIPLGRVDEGNLFLALRGGFRQGLGDQDPYQGKILGLGGVGLGFRAGGARVEFGATGGAVVADYRMPYEEVVYGEGKVYSGGGFKAALAARIHIDSTWDVRLESRVSQKVIGPVALGLAYDCQMGVDHCGAVVVLINPGGKGLDLFGHLGVRLLEDGSPDQIYGRVGVRADW